MTVRDIRLFGDPVLREVCRPVTDFGAGLARLVTDLTDTCRLPGRAGLAAPQIGVDLRVFCYNLDGEEGYLINPRLVSGEGHQDGPEACLSIPGLYLPTPRSGHAVVTGVDLDRRPVTVEGPGLLARCLQHELDHLDGHLYLDRLPPGERRQALRVLGDRLSNPARPAARPDRPAARGSRNRLRRPSRPAARRPGQNALTQPPAPHLPGGARLPWCARRPRRNAARVSLGGGESVTDDGTGVRARSSRTVALIAFLVIHAGSPQSRQRIAGLFWPDSADGQALTNLRRELHQLRQILGDEPSLIVTSRDLCWCDTQTCRVDVRTFDIEHGAAQAAAAAADDDGVLLHATRALAEYRGDLLPGVYEDWVLEARSQLERQCVELCDLVCAARARRGDLAGRWMPPAAGSGSSRSRRRAIAP